MTQQEIIILRIAYLMFFMTVWDGVPITVLQSEQDFILIQWIVLSLVFLVAAVDRLFRGMQLDAKQLIVENVIIQVQQ